MTAETRAATMVDLWAALMVYSKDALKAGKSVDLKAYSTVAKWAWQLVERKAEKRGVWKVVQKVELLVEH